MKKGIIAVKDKKIYLPKNKEFGKNLERPRKFSIPFDLRRRAQHKKLNLFLDE